MAERNQISIAKIIREMIDKCLPQAKDFRTNELFAIGKDNFAMGRKNGSNNHDKYIYHEKNK